ncbi:cardiolipin synthase [Sunxiuqinia elliptica]|uniref:Cardiolipin synthase n=1 Tax=Sunxiuqinia elliptica TaxID=655355 RepID=A0A4R6H893_9BACT|nr:cardiolipin synthase [Sunxiuqinia elliptica]TDO03831.1 cardiolipin synthetase 2 [Sunxiuqinia elliptica]TDO62113.1 cardiolipin synthetase 2 [Sunxiuqinia elliptica]
MLEFLREIWYYMPDAITVLYIVTVIFIAILIVLENRNPIKTISWVLVLVAVPVGGMIIYLFFGQEYRKKKMFSKKGLYYLEKLRKQTQDQLRQLPHSGHLFPENIVAKKHLINLALANSNALLSVNNEVTILKNGYEAFPAIFQAIEGARHHIHLEYYIVEGDELGNQLKDLLVRKARQGVEVRFIYDDVGSWQLPKKYIRELREAGVKIDCFMRVRFPVLTSRVNYRNHRKIIVIDGEIGFTGGLNFADRYIHGTRGLGKWRDTHLMVKGDAATSLQIVFMADWYFVSKEILRGEAYFKQLPASDGKLVQVVSSGPDSDWESIGQTYFSAIASASERVFIATPYLIPTSDIVFAMKTAALGGIDIRVLLPENSDAFFPKWSSDSYIEELLEAGVRIYHYKPGFTHSKLMVVDGIFSSVGTANMDFRSLETNFEVNAMVYDEEIAHELETHFYEDLESSEELVLREWKKRSKWRRAMESFARLLSPTL